MADFGSQKHVFTPVVNYVNKKVDSFFEITAEELDVTSDKVEEDRRRKEESTKPLFNMKRIDLNNPEDGSGKKSG